MQPINGWTGYVSLPKFNPAIPKVSTPPAPQAPPPDHAPVNVRPSEHQLPSAIVPKHELLTESHPFAEAVGIWITNHSQYIAPSTLKTYRNHINHLKAFFDQLPIGKLHIGNIRAYQTWRLETAASDSVNKEISTILAPILAEIDRWQYFIRVYKPLKMPKRRVRKSMTEDEMRRLLAIALDADKPRRLLAGHCLMVMCNTGMGFGEMRYLKRRDVILNEKVPIVTVNEGLKNEYRMRTIPLNWIALRSMRWIVRRWDDLGGTCDDQYILPHAGHRAPGDRNKHLRSDPIFEQPMATIWNAARKILDEAGLIEFDPYDMRSHFGTQIMQNPDLSEQDVGDLFGHSDTATRKRYFAPGMKKKVQAVERMAVDPAPTMRLIAFPGGKSASGGAQ